MGHKHVVDILPPTAKNTNLTFRKEANNVSTKSEMYSTAAAAALMGLLFWYLMSATWGVVAAPVFYIGIMVGKIFDKLGRLSERLERTSAESSQGRL